MPPEPAPEHDPGPLPILIVDDNAVNALILSAMLRKQGYDAEVARSGAEGVAMTVRRPARLILMDLQMPQLDGFTAAAEIRRACNGATPTLVAVTANAGLEVAAACRDAGFAGVLAKPVDYQELIATVRRCLRLAPGAARMN
jgi:CheY-like chemotaxis protein